MTHPTEPDSGHQDDEPPEVANVVYAVLDLLADLREAYLERGQKISDDLDLRAEALRNAIERFARERLDKDPTP